MTFVVTDDSRNQEGSSEARGGDPMNEGEIFCLVCQRATDDFEVVDSFGRGARLCPGCAQVATAHPTATAQALRQLRFGVPPSDDELLSPTESEELTAYQAAHRATLDEPDDEEAWVALASTRLYLAEHLVLRLRYALKIPTEFQRLIDEDRDLFWDLAGVAQEQGVALPPVYADRYAARMRAVDEEISNLQLIDGLTDDLALTIHSALEELRSGRPVSVSSMQLDGALKALLERYAAREKLTVGYRE